MEKYSDCMLIYKISENKPYGEINKKNYDKMKKALNAAGFFLDVENGVLKLQISQYGYERKQKRNAGRKKKCALKKENGEYGLYRYSDVVYMMQTMMDKEISNKREERHSKNIELTVLDGDIKALVNDGDKLSKGIEKAKKDIEENKRNIKYLIEKLEIKKEELNKLDAKREERKERLKVIEEELVNNTI